MIDLVYCQIMNDLHQNKNVDKTFLDKQSRTIGTFGLDTMLKLASTRVMIAGCRGIGAETAKNACLGGLYSLTLYDPTPCQYSDLGLNFAITLADINAGKSRAIVTSKLMKELNPNMKIQCVNSESEFKDEIMNHDVVIVTSECPQLSKNKLTVWNKLSRKSNQKSRPTSFILAFQQGLTGSIFVDHGPSFTTIDNNGRPAIQKIIIDVKEKIDDKNCKYTRIYYDTPEGALPGALQDHTSLQVTEVIGWNKLNSSGQEISINNDIIQACYNSKDPKNTIRVYPSFEEAGYSPYVSGGLLIEQKEIITKNFMVYDEAIYHPQPTIITNSKFDCVFENHIHLLVDGILTYMNDYNQFPDLYNTSDNNIVMNIIKEINRNNRHTSDSKFFIEQLDEDFLIKSIFQSAIQFQPYCALIGAITAQEIVKVTGKYTPIHQFLHFYCEGFEHLFETSKSEYLTNQITKENNQYYDLQCLLGLKVLEKLHSLNIFLIGCGALGCEDLKNFALCGMATDTQGSIIVTDNDKIELSNLSRQFLFREENIGQYKSNAAQSRIKTMNPSVNIAPMQEFVGEQNEKTFTDDFWMKKDLIVNALDNMKTRLYVDKQCVLHELVLLEAGTMGTGGNVDVIVPHKTTSYSDGGSADEQGGIPMCTLRNFPYIYEHCIEWAKAHFDDLFVAPMQILQQLRENPELFCQSIINEINEQDTIGSKRSIREKKIIVLEQIKSTIEVITGIDANDKDLLSNSSGPILPSMENCITLAWKSFHYQFRDRILSLTKQFPRDSVNSNGKPFWSHQRKFPSPIHVSDRVNNKEVYNYLIAALNLFACMLGIHENKHPAHHNNSNYRWKQEYRDEMWLDALINDRILPQSKDVIIEDLTDDLIKEEMDILEKDKQDENTFTELISKVKLLAGVIPHNIKQLEFEKDDDDNFHIDFITATANLRAINYGIKTGSKMQVKMIAGKIIPAVATTTAAVTGLRLVELLKIFSASPIAKLRSGMIDLGVNRYIMFEMNDPITIKSETKKNYDPVTNYTEEYNVIAWPEGHTKYDKLRIKVSHQTTVENFCNIIHELSKLNDPSGYTVSSIGYGKSLLWNGSSNSPQLKQGILELIGRAYITNSDEKNLSEEHMIAKINEFWSYKKQFSDLVVNIDTVNFEEVLPATILLLIE